MEKYAVVPWVICVVYDATAVALTVFKIWRYKKVGGASSPLFDLWVDLARRCSRTQSLRSSRRR